MSSNQQFLQNLYEAFNKREIETIVSFMRPDVNWANGLEGGFVYGRDAVRDYWTNQFKSIQPELETLKFETDENWDGQVILDKKLSFTSSVFSL